MLNLLFTSLQQILTFVKYWFKFSATNLYIQTESRGPYVSIYSIFSELLTLSASKDFRIALYILHKWRQNVVLDQYSCDKNCTSKNLTAEHILTVTKQHRFKQPPGDYILKWMTGSSLCRDTVTKTQSAQWLRGHKTMDILLQTDSFWLRVLRSLRPKGNHTRLLPSHFGEQSSCSRIDHISWLCPSNSHV